MATSSASINSLIQSFVAELTQIVRLAALEAVEAALTGGASPARRVPGRPRDSGKRRGPGRPKTAKAMPERAARGGKRGRRSSEDLDATAAKFLAYVKSNDGKRLEEIAAALKVPSETLKRPAQKLLAAKAVKTTGQRRGTKYHVGSGAAPAVAPAAAEAPAKAPRKGRAKKA
jgi:hypothetical protein